MFPGGRGEVQQGQGDARAAAAQPRTGVVVVRPPGRPPEQLERRLALPEQVEYVGHAVRAGVQARPERSGTCGVHEPPDVPGVDRGAGGVQGVEDTGRAVGEAQGSLGELGDVSGEEPVGALGGGHRRYPLGERVPDQRPVGVRGGQQGVHLRPALSEFGPGRAAVGRRGAQQAADLGGVAGGHREPAFDGVGELGGLARVEGRQLCQREEQPEPDRGQAVQVDLRPGVPRRRGEAGGAERGAPEVLDRTGEFEVDEADVTVGPDDQVTRVEVAEDHAPGVDRGQAPLDPVHDAQGLAGVVGHRVLVGVRVDQRVVRGQPLAERLALDELLYQEPVFPGGQQPVQDGYAGHAGQSGEHVVLLLHPGDGVDPALVQAGVRPGLLQYHRRPARRVTRQVDAARVGEVQDPLHGVGQLRALLCGACGQRRCEAGGYGCPRRDGEPGAAYVGHQPSVRVLQGEHALAGFVAAVPFGESPVPQVQRALAPAQVAEDVRTPAAGQQSAQAVQTSLQLGLVHGVQGAELPARTARGVLRVLHLEDRQPAQELERDVLPQAVLPDLLQHRLGVLCARGHVDLPALRGKVDVGGSHHAPDLELAVLPPRGQRPGDGRELLLGAPAPGRVVEERIGEGVGLVPVVQRNPPRSGRALAVGRLCRVAV